MSGGEKETQYHQNAGITCHIMHTEYNGCLHAANV